MIELDKTGRIPPDQLDTLKNNTDVAQSVLYHNLAQARQTARYPATTLAKRPGGMVALIVDRYETPEGFRYSLSLAHGIHTDERPTDQTLSADGLTYTRMLLAAAAMFAQL